MTSAPFVSVITPTWRRPLQLARCAYSIALQDFDHARLEHVIVSDHDPVLLATDVLQYLAQLERHFGHRIRFEMLDTHRDPGWWGHDARLRGLELAQGDLICWLDDDDAYRPQHVTRHVEALTAHPEAGFSFSRVWIGSALANTGRRDWSREEENQIHGGPPYPDAASIHGPQVFMHRRELTATATWREEGGPEWQLVQRWLAAGVKWAWVDEVTVDAWQHDDYYEHVYGRQVCGTTGE